MFSKQWLIFTVAGGVTFAIVGTLVVGFDAHPLLAYMAGFFVRDPIKLLEDFLRSWKEAEETVEEESPDV